MMLEKPIYSESINRFSDIIEDLEHPRIKKLDLDDYQKYNLAIEAMKTDAQHEMTSAIKSKADDLTHILNDTPSHPFAIALNEIADALGGAGEFPTLSVDSHLSRQIDDLTSAIRGELP